MHEKILPRIVDGDPVGGSKGGSVGGGTIQLTSLYRLPNNQGFRLFETLLSMAIGPRKTGDGPGGCSRVVLGTFAMAVATGTAGPRIWVRELYKAGGIGVICVAGTAVEESVRPEMGRQRRVASVSGPTDQFK